MRGVCVASLMLVLMSSCVDSGGGAEGEGEPEPFSDCSTDRDCGDGSICDKTADGDDIPVADDDRGVCIAIAGPCFCNDIEVACTLRICEPARFACFTDDDCVADEVCHFTDGRRPVCEVPATFTPTTVLLSRTVALAGEEITAAAWADGVDGRVVVGAPFVVRAVCETGVCEQRIEVGGATALLRVHARARRQLIVADTLGAPIVGAQVRTIRGEIVENGVTDANGVFSYDDVVDVISVVAAGVEGHSIAVPADNVLVVLRGLQRVVVGTTVDVAFDDVTSRGDIKLSVANSPINGDLAAFSLTDVFGGSSAVRVDISGVTPAGGQLVAINDGSVLSLGAEDFRARGVVVADVTPANKLLVWSLAGRVQLSKIGPMISAGALSRDLVANIAFGFSSVFDHDVTVVAADNAAVFAPAADADLDGIADALPASTGFAATTTKPDTLAVRSEEYPDDIAGRSFGVVGVEIPGLGFMPLGLHEEGGVGDENVGVIDFAPAHDGFEALPTKTIIVAYDERPWAATSSMRLRTAAAFSPDAVGTVSVADNAVVIDDVDNVSVSQMRIVADGFVWNFWARGSARLPIDSVVIGTVPATHVAAAITWRRLDDEVDAQVIDGQLAHVLAMTRTQLP